MNTSMEVQQTHKAEPTKQYDAIVIGAGPYGLSVAAHLRARGLKIAIFGKPLALWRDHMPVGMLLRSYWWASSLSHPEEKRYDFAAYLKQHPGGPIDPLPAETFIKYGLWFQQQAVPDVDETFVRSVKQEDKQFQVELEDGRILQSRTVVMAPGLRYYKYSPAEFSHLPTELATHTSDYATFDQFVGKKVIIIGGGQGALETAALAHENGVDIQLVSRRSLVWIPEPEPEPRSLRSRLRNPQAGTGAGWFDWGIEHVPYGFQRLSRQTKDTILSGVGAFGPMGSYWLRKRVLDQFPVHQAQAVQEMKETDGHVEVALTNGTTLQADHVLLGTGYRVDVHKLPMLDQSVLSNIQTYKGAPVLNNQFESSIAGMYFVGFSSLSSCGPLYRFVVGTKAAARRVASAIERQAARTR